MPELNGTSGKLYDAEHDWLVRFDVVGPEDPRFDGTHWQAYAVKKDKKFLGHIQIA